MSILIRGATIVAMDETHGSKPFQGDILIEGDSIKWRNATVHSYRCSPSFGSVVPRPISASIAGADQCCKQP